MNTKTKDRLLTAGAIALMSLGGFSTSGCATTNFNIQYQHVSHLSAGWPSGPTNEEDTLDHIAACAERSLIKSLGATTEVCVGYRLRDGGFYGPRDTASLTIKVPVFPNRGRFE